MHVPRRWKRRRRSLHGTMNTRKSGCGWKHRDSSRTWMGGGHPLRNTVGALRDATKKKRGRPLACGGGRMDEMVSVVITRCHVGTNAIAFESVRSCIRRLIRGFRGWEPLPNQLDHPPNKIAFDSWLFRVHIDHLDWTALEIPRTFEPFLGIFPRRCRLVLCRHGQHVLGVLEDNASARGNLTSRRNPIHIPSLGFVRRNPSIRLLQARGACACASDLAMPSNVSSFREETPSSGGVRPPLNSIELIPSVGSIRVSFRAATVGDACCARAAVEHG